MARPRLSLHTQAVDNAPVCPGPVLERDAEILIGVLAVVEGEMMISQLSPGLLDQLSRRFSSVGLTVDGASDRELRQAIDDLGQRLRYALGEYDDPPEQMPVP